MFIPRLEILPESQRMLWEKLSNLPGRFVLYGGTALALRLGHRQSVDFDFFSSRPLNSNELMKWAPVTRDGEVIQEEKNTVTIRIQTSAPVKISFFGGLTLRRVGQPDETSAGVRIASLEDLFATKLHVICQRAESKDYLDVAAILNAGLDLERGLGCAKAVYGNNYNPMLPQKALVHFEGGDLFRLSEDLKQKLRVAVSSVRTIPDVKWDNDNLSA